MKIEIEVDENEVIIQILKKEKQTFMESLSKIGVPMYSYDEVEEKKEVKKVIKSFNRLLKFYGAKYD
jgi:predicted HTH domain antitoxin